MEQEKKLKRVTKVIKRARNKIPKGISEDGFKQEWNLLEHGPWLKTKDCLVKLKTEAENSDIIIDKHCYISVLFYETKCFLLLDVNIFGLGY